MQPRRTLDLNQPPPVRSDAPYVQPGADPRAAGYAAGISARRGLPKYSEPVAGGPTPPMPALEQPHQPGMTMAQQAHATRGNDSSRHVAQALSQHRAVGGIVVPDAPQQARPDSVGGLLLQPTDVLPEEAVSDPAYQQGAGSRMAQMQPRMAAKYGVLRNGKRLTPNDLMGGSQPDFRGQRPKRSSEEIARDFQQAIAAPTNVTRNIEEGGPVPPPGIPRDEREAEEQAAAGPGGAAYRAGSAPVAPVLDASSEESEARAKKMIESMDDFDFERLRREMLSDILKNPGQRESVEKRLQPLDISELIMKNTVRQRVPILPGRFEPTFESMPGTVELQLKQMLVQESKSIAVTEAYLLDKYAVMTTTAGTVAINGNPVPSMYDAHGELSEDLFWIKFTWMLKRNIHMLASLGVHYSWFEQRVRKLFVADEGKGG